ncbi:MAG: NUDIX hydrolase, partial [Patescibacteria group bacterium]
MNPPNPIKLQNKVVISAILEKNTDKGRYIYTQIRWKPKVSPTYSGLVEIPAGAVDPYENIYDTLSREVLEETGLQITEIIDDKHDDVTENKPNDRNHVFVPFLCQQSLETNGGLPWIGFVFRCKVKGEVKIQLEEAKDPKWLHIDELTKLIYEEPENIFPLQYPVLKHYIETLRNQ